MQKKPKIFIFLQKINEYEENLRNKNTGSSSFKDLIDIYDRVRSMFVKPSIPIVSSSDSDEQQEQGAKILTPKQTIIRLPVSLAQLKAGNNPLKNLKMK